MKLPNISITKNESGQHAWNRVISYMCALTMCVAFIKEATTNALEWLDYIGFGAGMAIAYSPVLAVKIIAAWRGKSCDAPPATPGKIPPAPEGGY